MRAWEYVAESDQANEQRVDAVLAEVRVEVLRQQQLPGIRTPLAPTRRDNVELAAHQVRAALVSD